MAGTEQFFAWARGLEALAHTGLYYAKNEFDVERFEAVRQIAAEMIASASNLSVEEVRTLNRDTLGYATPKVDVRGVVFREGKILMVREVLDHGRWTLPGGWADVNESPAEAVVREVFEESGFKTRAVELLALYDREKQGHPPPLPVHIWKVFFRCEITGGAPAPNHEASEIAFFGPGELPELSVSRTTHAQLEEWFRRMDDPPRPATYDT